MSASALTLVILAGLIHAGWNIAAKRVGGALDGEPELEFIEVL